jgi:hypothetical protein
LEAFENPAMVAGGAAAASVARSEEYSLRAAGARPTTAEGDDAAGGTDGGDGAGRGYAADDHAADGELYMILRAGDRYSRGGGDVRYRRHGRRGLSYLLAATGQWGDDGHFAGLYSDEAGGTASLSKRWSGGATLTVAALGGVSERGARSASTAEAFTLTGDRGYNPLWGLQAGRVRNSAATLGRHLLSAVELSHPAGRNGTLTATVALRRARVGRTRLAWYDAASPLPDYYRSMPSFFPDWQASETIADAWREGDPTVTQVDWDAIYYSNTLAPDGCASYILEEQVERSRDLHAALTLRRRPSPGVELTCGVKARRDEARRYKEARDMLGATWVPNTDQYATDVEGEYHLGPPEENDLRNPGRRVVRGERFGYDYALRRFVPSVFATVVWNGRGRGATLSGSLGHTVLRRRGFYEKALFAGDGARGSYGPSPAAAFTTFSLAAAAWADVGRRGSLSLAATVSTEAPFADDLFLSPRQSNMAIAGPVPSGLYGAEVAWARAGEWTEVKLTGFVNAATGETQTRQYYDDLSSTFVDMVVRGVDRLGYGLEAGVEARPARWIALRAGASAGRYRYNSEPAATLYDDATGEVISEGIVCYMSGLAVGPPQRTAGGEVELSDGRYLRLSVSGEWLGGRFVEVNPLYHSSRVAGVSPSPEVMAAFTDQERLPDAFTLGASVSKGWAVGGGWLRVAASVRNLLSADIVHSGYEQMRIRRLGTGADRTLVPFPSKYVYAWPCTWNVTVSYRI